MNPNVLNCDNDVMRKTKRKRQDLHDLLDLRNLRSSFKKGSRCAPSALRRLREVDAPREELALSSAGARRGSLRLPLKRESRETSAPNSSELMRVWGQPRRRYA